MKKIKTKHFKNDKEIRHYYCGYCSTKFSQAVCQSGPTKKSEYTEGNPKTCSDQVVCPQCQNFIRTWS